jgi:hypothetical protein
MRAIGEPVRSVARDVKAVRWLPLEEAVEKLSRARERLFLDSIAPALRDAVERSARQDSAAERRSGERFTHEIPVEPAVQSPDTAVVELIQPSGPGDFAAAGAKAPRDNLAAKLRLWFRRISGLNAQSARRA